MLQTRTVRPELLELLKRLMDVDELSHFSLVGGTALALQLGHRFSEDIDMFCFGGFDPLRLQKTLNDRFAPDFNVTNNYCIQFSHQGVKVDLLDYPYPPRFAEVVTDGVRMLDIRDIIPMKLSAICNRGVKKDFFDLYFLLRNHRFDEMLHFYSERFEQSEVVNVIRSVQYFDDAENNPDPICFEKVTWMEVKRTIQREVRAYLK